MAMNVGFKLGTQAKLNELTSYEAGSFYLTNDSNRLYFAQTTEKLVDLNQYVRTVKNVQALPTTTTLPSLQAGDFYYALAENVFCIRNNTNTGWQQINPDTYLAANTAAITVGNVTNGASVTTTVKDTADNTVTGNFSIVGGTDITVTPDSTNRKITIASTAHDTTYTLKTNTNNAGATVKLDANDAADQDSSITIESAATDLLTVTSDANGKVTLTPTDQYVDSVTNKFDANGGFTTTVKDGEGEHTSSAITPIVKYGNTEVDAKFINGTANLDVYTINETNNKIANEIAKNLRTADAMYFAGTVGTGGSITALPGITTVSNGTTYKVVSNLTGTVSAKTGDIVIASGTEDTTTGKITSGEWLVVPAGDDQFLIGEATASTVLIKDRLADEQIAAITLQDVTDNPVEVNGVVGADKAHTTFTIKHDDTNTVGSVGNTNPTDVTQSAQSTAEFTAITKLVVDKYGHVSEAKANKITVTDTHNSLTSNYLTATGGSAENGIGGTVTVTSSVSTVDDGTKAGTMTMASETLHISGSSTSNKGAINIDLIWGSF